MTRARAKAATESREPDLILRVKQKALVGGRRALEFEATARNPRLDLYHSPFESAPFGEDPRAHFRELLGELDGMQEGGEDWLKGRRARRETGNKVAPEIIRRPSSSSDRRLRKLYNGERGLPFKRTEEL